MIESCILESEFLIIKYLFKCFKCVCSKEFEDLDEIVARYVQPMASFARDLLNHKYYQDCNGGDKKVSLSQAVVGCVGDKGA